MSNIEEKIVQIIADSLVLDSQDIELTSRFLDDLGVDSLDFLDIVFSLEKEFKINLRDQELEQLAQEDNSIDGAEQERFLTFEEIDKISKWIPELAKLPAKDKVSSRELFALLTVESIVILIKTKQNSG